MKLEKAEEPLQAAELCFSQKLYNSTANRCYYAMFQAAIVALAETGFRKEEWSHPALQATFSNKLIQRRKVYPKQLAYYLNKASEWRNIADYGQTDISQKRANELLFWARNFVSLVRERR